MSIGQFNLSLDFFRVYFALLSHSRVKNRWRLPKRTWGSLLNKAGRSSWKHFIHLWRECKHLSSAHNSSHVAPQAANRKIYIPTRAEAFANTIGKRKSLHPLSIAGRWSEHACRVCPPKGVGWKQFHFKLSTPRERQAGSYWKNDHCARTSGINRGKASERANECTRGRGIMERRAHVMTKGKGISQ